jgi:hypothetical protein
MCDRKWRLNPLLGRGKGRQALGWVVTHGGPTPALRDRCRCATAVATVKVSQAFTPSKERIFLGDRVFKQSIK